MNQAALADNVSNVSSYRGIDVSRFKLDGAPHVPTANTTTKPSTVTTNVQAGFEAPVAWLERQRVAGLLHVCMEATDVYWVDIAAYSSDGEHMVSVIHSAFFQGARAVAARSK